MVHKVVRRPGAGGAYQQRESAVSSAYISGSEFPQPKPIPNRP